MRCSYHKLGKLFKNSTQQADCPFTNEALNGMWQRLLSLSLQQQQQMAINLSKTITITFVLMCFYGSVNLDQTDRYVVELQVFFKFLR